MDINKIKKELISQKESKFKGNVYHYSQVNFSYKSNKIEGNRLTSDQTEAIFDTSSFIPKSDKMYLTDTIKHEQDLYGKTCEELLNFEIEGRIDYAKLLKELVKDYTIDSVVKPFIICFIGGPGYGKSFLSKLISKRENIPIISNDKTRRLLDSIGLDSTNQDVVHKLAYLQMEYLIKHHSKIIIDANAIRQHSIISKKAKELNVKCYYVNLLCNQDIILERLDYRESQFGKNDNYSRATKKDYLDYQGEIKNIIFPAEKIFFEIKTDEELDKQVEKLFEKIERDI